MVYVFMYTGVCAKCKHMQGMGHVKMSSIRAGEMAQQLRALAALPEDPDPIPSTHVVANNYL